MPASLTNIMVSDSWEMAQILQGDAVICQDQHGTEMEVQISVISTITLSGWEPTWQ